MSQEGQPRNKSPRLALLPPRPAASTPRGRARTIIEAIEGRALDRSRSGDRWADDKLGDRLAIMDQDPTQKETLEIFMIQTANLKRKTTQLATSQGEVALRETALGVKESELGNAKAQLLKEQRGLKVLEQANEMNAQQLSDAVNDLFKEKATAQRTLSEAEHRFRTEEITAAQAHQQAVQKLRGDETLQANKLQKR